MYSRTNLTFYYFLAFFLLTGKVNAQLKCKIEHFSTEDGLSHDALTCMMKDKQGFMWFGTWNGINRFDGHNFVSYKSFPGDLSTLKNDRIDQIVEDNSNHLWLKAYDNQIYRFDKRSEQFEPFADVLKLRDKKKVTFDRIISANDGDIWLISAHDGIFFFPKTDTSLSHYVWFNAKAPIPNRISDNKTRILREDRDHNMWVGTPNGTTLLNRSGPSIYRASTLNTAISTGQNITSIEDGGTQVYMATAQGNIITYAKRTGKFMMNRVTTDKLNCLIVSKQTGNLYAAASNGDILTVNTKSGQIISKSKCPNGPVASIFEDHKGFLWMTPETEGLLRFDPRSGTFQAFFQRIDAKFNRNGNHVRVFEDNEGIVWASMKGGGFGYYDEAQAKFCYFYNEPGTSGRRLSNIVTDLYYDKAGILWLNTDERGVDRVVFQRNDFQQRLVDFPGLFKSDNEIRGILSDHKGRLWLGAKSGKLYVYENDKVLRGLFINEPSEGLGQVYSLLEDHLKNIWLGTKSNGLYRAAPIDKNCTKYRLTQFVVDDKKANSISSNEIYALVEDRKGRMWVGTYDEGLNLLVNQGSEVKFIHSGKSFELYPKTGFRKIRNMAIDGKGHLWAGTTDGLMIVNADNAGHAYDFSTYSKIPGDKTSLGNNDIQYIFRDSRDTMWLGTSGGGLDEALGGFANKQLKFRNFTSKDGLPNDYILSCTQDQTGNLWIASQNGLSKFNLQSKAFRNYDSYDGLPKTSFSEAACANLPNSSLVFGTVKGYLAFDPAGITDHKIAANLVFTNLLVNNVNFSHNPDNPIFKGDINYTSGLTLPYYKNTINLDYTVLDPRSGIKQSYSYRLKNFDNSWHSNENQRRITYTDLPPGRYALEVRSQSSDLYTNEPFKKLNIEILPPPWRTWWAYMLYLLAILIIAETIRRIALTVLRLRHNIAVEKRLATLKMSFFTNVSHELRTPLTLILNPIAEIEKMITKEGVPAKGIEYIRVVKRNAERMVRFINQLLDLRKVQSGKVELKISQVNIGPFILHINSYFSEIAREKNIDLKVEGSDGDLAVWIDAEKMDIVIYNILANAFKFSPAGHCISIKITPMLANGTVNIAIRDEGGGVKAEHLNDIFELYYEGDHGEDSYVKGTGIGLALSKELVELHKGKIWAENGPVNGLIVTVEIRIGKEHFDSENVVFIEQPVTGHDLIPMAGNSSLRSETPVAAQQSRETPLLLLVEDNVELRDFLSVQLSDHYRIESAENGAEGLKKALDMLPDLIISDVMMPVMNGIAMLNQLKNDLATSHIPVVILSAKSSVENQIEGLKYGADFYITKPFQNDYLLASVENLLSKRKKIFETLMNGKKIIELAPGEIAITSHDESFLKRIIEIVEEKMIDPDFNINTVAELMNMSRTPFYRKFKSLTNLAPVEFVREMRLKRAKQYFDGGNLDISDVAFQVGFGNNKYFSKCYKEQYGISPTDYLKSKTDRK
jgi:signal transduction histidine kinase/ligand-binding sensor domain-containing protein/AraC-like DNA-binding protein